VALAIFNSWSIKETKVVKPEWGVKRTCNSCGAKFYDLQRSPIICPKCDATVDPVVATRSQRTKTPVAPVKVVPKAAVVKVADDADDDDADPVGDDALKIVEDDDDDDDAAAIEDVSELGEDADDILGVKVAGEGEETN
jgi:uncharacterized protein (TIGR02300 family)